jgi:hypothetical protein
MSRRTKRWVAALAICSGATLFQVGTLPTGCAQFGTQLGLALFDACSVLNCTGSTFFNFCDPVVSLVDCPDVEGP